jgi:hypothetical protein
MFRFELLDLGFQIIGTGSGFISFSTKSVEFLEECPESKHPILFIFAI